MINFPFFLLFHVTPNYGNSRTLPNGVVILSHASSPLVPDLLIISLDQNRARRGGGGGEAQRYHSLPKLWYM